MNQLDRNLGQKPLLPFVDEEDFTPAYKAVMDPIKARRGSLSNSSRATAHGDELAANTRAFLESTWDLGDLPRPFRALIRYKVATTNTCFYCSTHQLGYLQKMGVDAAKIADISDFETSPAFDERERAALGFVDAMTRDASNIPDAIAERFVATFTPKERVEIGIVACAMGFLNTINDAFRIPVEDEVVDVAIAVPELAGDK